MIDVTGWPTQAADDSAARRMAAHGVTVTSSIRVLAEPAIDRANRTGSAIQTVMCQKAPRRRAEASISARGG